MKRARKLRQSGPLGDRAGGRPSAWPRAGEGLPSCWPSPSRNRRPRAAACSQATARFRRRRRRSDKSGPPSRARTLARQKPRWPARPTAEGSWRNRCDRDRRSPCGGTYRPESRLPRRRPFGRQRDHCCSTSWRPGGYLRPAISGRADATPPDFHGLHEGEGKGQFPDSRAPNL